MASNVVVDFAAQHSYASRGRLGPAWRLRLLNETTASVGPLLRGVLHADEVLRNLFKYQEVRANSKRGNTDAEKEFPLIAAAEQLNADATTVELLKLMIVAGLTEQEIHGYLKIDVAVVTTWESVFFDVRELRQTAGWMTVHVFEKERKRGHFEFASRLKLAVAGGHEAIRAILADDTQLPLDEADRIARRRLALDLKLDAALAMPITDERRAVQFARFMLTTSLESKRIGLAEKVLVQRCADVHARHELSKLRLEQSDRLAEIEHDRWQEKIKRRDEIQMRRNNQADAKKAAAELRSAAAMQLMNMRILKSPLAQLRWGRTHPSPTNSTAPHRLDGYKHTFEDEGDWEDPASSHTSNESHLELLEPVSV